MQVTNHTSQGYAAGLDRNRRLVDQPLNGHRPSLTAARTGLRVQSAQSPEKRGKPGNDLDLNALVCRNLCSEKFEKCINSLKGEEGGIGWAERFNFIEKELARAMDGI